MDTETDNEIGEFQNEVRNLVIELSGAPDSSIDGKGSDAGWQEFTLAEISQGFAFLKDQNIIDRAHLIAALKEAKGSLQLAKDVTSHGFLPNPKTKRFDMTHFDVHESIDRALATINQALEKP